MEKEIIEVEGPDRANKLCKCHNCGDIDICTVNSEFYSLKQVKDDNYLYCEPCFWMKVTEHQKKKSGN